MSEADFVLLIVVSLIAAVVFGFLALREYVRFRRGHWDNLT